MPSKGSRWGIYDGQDAPNDVHDYLYYIQDALYDLNDIHNEYDAIQDIISSHNKYTFIFDLILITT